jgi:hypothetical protein
VISPFTFVAYVIPAIGMCFAAGLFAVTGVLDSRALRRAEEWERVMSEPPATPPPVIEEPVRNVAVAEPQEQRKSAAAMANLAEGIQALVGHMRQEQQEIRGWVEAQSAQQDDIRRLLRRLDVKNESEAKVRQ